MSSKGYHTAKKTTTSYEFVSTGPKGSIRKRVEFIALKARNYYNVGFGDIMKDGTVNDLAYSGNQDIVKVIATVISVMRDFLEENPDAILAFTGSSDDRTNFYCTILKRHYKSLSKEFAITALVKNSSKDYVEEEFEPDSTIDYLAFFIKNKM